jgi:hypothetical protein
MRSYAFCHPGKIGDALYVLPTIRVICERDQAAATFITSEVCRPLERLFLYQKHVEDFIIPPGYEIESYGQGVQPWKMPVPPGYDKVYQLGYERFPNKALHLVTGLKAGLSLSEIPAPRYDFPDLTFSTKPYIVVAFSGSRGYPPMYDAYQQMIKECPILVIQTGIDHDWVDAPSLSGIGLDLLDVLPLIAKSELFVGFYSGLLALANGFPDLPKIATLQHHGCGEQHGPDIANTTRILFPPGPTVQARYQIFQKALLDTVSGILGVDKR